MVKESILLRSVLSSAPYYKSVLFRNNVGLFSTINKVGSQRMVRTGLCKGSSDGIGWTERVITEGMVGKKIAIFTAIETKSEKGKATVEQKEFINRVLEAGGIAGIVRDLDKYNELMKGN